MSEPVRETSLLEELDQRQNQVLDELERLNLRLESLLDEYLGKRKAASPAAAPILTLGASQPAA